MAYNSAHTGVVIDTAVSAVVQKEKTWDGKAENKAFTGATTSANGAMGLVPAPTAGAATRFLRSDGAWVIPPNDNTTYAVMVGATTSAAGISGLVPAPSAGAANRYLRSDGSWVVPPNDNTTYSAMTGATTSAAGKAGLVPAPAAGAATRFLRSDGTWVVPPDTNTTYAVMTAATASAAGAAGLVPAPAAGKQASFLRGDGTWQVPSTGTDTKNTAGSTNSSSKLFLIGATSQAANPQTYSHDTAYVGTDGCLYSGSTKVATKVLYTATLTTTWTSATTGYTQNVTVSGVLASDTPVIGIVQTTTVATNQTLLENWALVSRITTAANKITAYAYGDKPTVALPIQILCVR